MRTLTAILLLSSFAFSGCYHRSKKYWSREEAKMERCRGDWTYLDLDQPKEVSILLFRKKFDFMRIYPAFIIGVTSDHDTIAAIDKDFDTIMKAGQKVIISPSEWTPMEKVEIDPVFSVYPRTATNDLHCTVKKVYYVHFQPVGN